MHTRNLATAICTSPRWASGPWAMAARAGSMPGVLKTTQIPSRRSTARWSSGVNWIDTAAVYGMGHSEEWWPRPRVLVWPPTLCLHEMRTFSGMKRGQVL